MDPLAADVLDAVVVGGGAAGCAAARLLADWGHSVALLPGAPARRPRAESLPPSCRKPLGLVGLLQAVEAAGFLETAGNSAAWETGTLRSTPFGGPTGFQVERTRLDAVMQEAARAAGAEVLAAASAREVEVAGDGAVVRWAAPGAAGRLRARWVIDASGRAGVLARRGHRLRFAGPATTAILGEWRGHRPADVPPDHTVVEAYPGGWVWSVPLSADRHHVAVMVDPAVTPIRGAPLGRVYREELARTRHLARILEGHDLVLAPWARTATPYAARRYAGERSLLVGDAASFIDPLSSFGVKKALASGWLGAVATHTALIAPDRAAAARALFEERERIAVEHFAALAASFYRAAAGRFDGAFWTRRTRGNGVPPREDGSDAADRAFGSDHAAGLAESSGFPDNLRGPAAEARIRQALAAIRAAPSLRMRPAPGLRRERRPTVRGREVVVEEHLFSPALSAGIRFIGPVELPLLLDLLADECGVPALYEAYLRVRPGVVLPDFLRALSALLAYGFVEGPYALAAR